MLQEKVDCIRDLQVLIHEHDDISNNFVQYLLFLSERQMLVQQLLLNEPASNN